MNSRTEKDEMCRNRWNSWISHFLTGAFILTAGVMYMVCTCIEAHAEEIQIFREESGDLEQLQGVELSETELEGGLKNLPNSMLRDTEPEVNEEEYTILDYGSDYGYRDMLKRSNSEARQYLYRQLESGCRAFTVSESDAGTVTTSGGSVYSSAFEVDLTGYELSSDEKMEVYFIFRHDNPQFFWLSNTVVYSSRKIVALTYDDYKNGAARKTALDEIVNTAETVYRPRILSADSLYKKTLAIHDTLIKEIDYSYDTSIAISHSIAGAMTSQKSAVCEGYAKVMQLFMNSCGIENIYITGYANGGHAWNLVRMSDGQYYWLDATWDDQPSIIYQHLYFLVGNENFTDHIPDTPEETGTSFLYELPAVSDKDYDPESKAEEVLLGDISMDNTINLFDMVMCLNHTAQKTILYGNAWIAGDVNEDGEINLFDLMNLLNYIAHDREKMFL